MANIFESMGHFFERLFGKAATLYEAVVHDVAKYAQAAEPIVAEISAIASAVASQDGSSAAIRLSQWLETIVKDTDAVSSWAVANAAAPLSNVLHNAAVFALAHTKGLLNVALKDLELAVQMAYNVYSKQHPESTGKSTVASISK